MRQEDIIDASCNVGVRSLLSNHGCATLVSHPLPVGYPCCQQVLLSVPTFGSKVTQIMQSFEYEYGQKGRGEVGSVPVQGYRRLIQARAQRPFLLLVGAII
jgi:hypothetical protein